MEIRSYRDHKATDVIRNLLLLGLLLHENLAQIRLMSSDCDCVVQNESNRLLIPKMKQLVLVVGRCTSKIFIVITHLN